MSNQAESMMQDQIEGAISENEALRQEVERLRTALLMAVCQNEHDMLMTGEELRICRAALEA